jgi:hypothetical protein
VACASPDGLARGWPRLQPSTCRAGPGRMENRSDRVELAVCVRVRSRAAVPICGAAVPGLATSAEGSAGRPGSRRGGKHRHQWQAHPRTRGRVRPILPVAVSIGYNVDVGPSVFTLRTARVQLPAVDGEGAWGGKPTSTVGPSWHPGPGRRPVRRDDRAAAQPTCGAADSGRHWYHTYACLV